MNNEIKNELIGMLDDVKKHVSARKVATKKLVGEAKKKFLNDSNTYSIELTIDIIKKIIEKYVDNKQGELYSHRKSFDYLFSNIRRLRYYCSDLSSLDAIYQYGFDKLASDKKYNIDDENRLLVTWQKEKNVVVPAFLEKTLFLSNNLDIELLEKEQRCYRIIGSDEDIETFVFKALGNLLGDDYKLPQEYINRINQKLREITKNAEIIKNIKNESRKNADVYCLDIIRKLNIAYKEKVSKDADIDKKSEIEVTIPTDASELMKILKERDLLDVFFTYDYLPYMNAIQHETNGENEYLLVLDSHYNVVEREICEMFSIRYSCFGETITVPVSNFEETVLNLARGSKKK